MSNINSTIIRPRPPSFQLKKSSPPPPPYGQHTASSDPNNFSESVTARHIHALANDVFSGDVPSAIEEWINERPREELSSLLVRANELIRERERELTMTSELSKNLYNSNITLEEKHKALLARLPSASALTPRTTPASSPAPTPEYHTTTLPPLRSQRTRRISVSPSDLSLLSDQNAELLQKLEKLEAESGQADLAGRRRLGKLEKEIDFLREELDQYRARGEALQLQVQRDEESRKRKQEWDDRVRAHRGKSGSQAEETDAEDSVRDFAPNSRRPMPPLVIPKPTVRVAAEDMPLPPSATSSSHNIFVFPSHPSPSPATPVASPSTGESALVAQLVCKVRELELANEQIQESQRDTATKLHEAQLEAEGIRRLYAFFGEDPDVELEVVEDGEPAGPHVNDANDTMRFRSLRRSITGDISKLSLAGFERGIGDNMESTVRGSGRAKGAPLRARKTVVGLFDTPVQPLPDVPEAPAMISNPCSPALSSLDFPGSGAHSFSSRNPSHLPTLGSELGSEYGGDFTENHHLRSSSLYDVFASRPSTPSRPTTPPMSPSRDLHTPSNVLPNEPSLTRQPFEDTDKTPQKSNHQHRLSDTIRSRTHYWVDKRFQYTTPFRRRSSLHRVQAENTTPLATTSDSKRAVAQVEVQTAPPAIRDDALVLVKADTTPKPQPTSEVASLETKKSRTMTVVLELWLWLQFIIIIMVFLWAVAKRGPRSVVREAERMAKRVE
ncbi:hypothetical protein BC834DRAFT_968426 [Gloeopeniophorella convolvens]|nr:hypothetical protein BC834DRAFT_968426 [Gloeopeniophorella convolvens]